MGVPVCTIDATGIHAPSFRTIIEFLLGQYRSIYGADAYLGNDSQDYQWIAVVAAALSDTNAMAVAAFNSFSPATAQGTGLSSVVKINGIARAAPSYSTVDLTIVGQIGTTINGGIAQDTSGNDWTLPSVVVIPSAGQVVATATAANLGAVTAIAGSVTRIKTPTLGWQGVTNALAASLGAPVESDAALRQRQAISTALPSLSVRDGLQGAIASLPGVTRLSLVENDTAATDANGIPSHSISLIVEGGDAQTIADTILLKKGPGCGTYGAVAETSLDANGVPHTIQFNRPTEQIVNVVVTVKALPGYTSVIGGQIQAAVAAAISSLVIGEQVYFTRLFAPATLPEPAGDTYDIVGIAVGLAGSTAAAANVPITFAQVAAVGAVTVTAT